MSPEGHSIISALISEFLEAGGEVGNSGAEAGFEEAQDGRVIEDVRFDEPPRVNGYSMGPASRFLDDLPVEILPTAAYTNRTTLEAPDYT